MGILKSLHHDDLTPLPTVDSTFTPQYHVSHSDHLVHDNSELEERISTATDNTSLQCLPGKHPMRGLGILTTLGH